MDTAERLFHLLSPYFILPCRTEVEKNINMLKNDCSFKAHMYNNGIIHTVVTTEKIGRRIIYSKGIPKTLNLKYISICIPTKEIGQIIEVQHDFNKDGPLECWIRTHERASIHDPQYLDPFCKSDRRLKNFIWGFQHREPGLYLLTAKTELIMMLSVRLCYNRLW